MSRLNQIPDEPIKEIFVFVADENQGEGIIALNRDGNFMPLVGTCMERARELKPLATEIGNAFNKKVKLLRFSVREEIETL